MADCFSTKEILAVILQYVNENECHETARSLEKESGIFFDVNHLEEKVLAGEWEELEKYLLGFIKIDNNPHSIDTFYQIRMQKYLEALDRNEASRAVDILREDLKVFSQFDEPVFKDVCNLLTLNNVRENEKLTRYGDAQTSRRELVMKLKRLVEANPVFRGKLEFPSSSSARLRSIMEERLSNMASTSTSAAGWHGVLGASTAAHTNADDSNRSEQTLTPIMEQEEQEEEVESSSSK